MKRAVAPQDVHQPFGPYSIAIEKNGVLYVSGQGPFDADQQLAGDDIAEQSRRTLDNLQRVLAAAGYRLEDVVKVNVYLQDINDWTAFNEVYGNYFPVCPPARTTIGCKLNGMLVELDCIAAK